MELSEAVNAGFLEEQYRRWTDDEHSVPREWQLFFQGVRFSEGRPTGAGSEPEQMLAQARVEALKYRYRDLGHLLACMDPLGACPTEHPLLALSTFGLSSGDLERPFYSRRFSDNGQAPLKDIIRALKETYCRSIGVEYMHIQDPEERKWLQDRMEPQRNRPPLSTSGRERMLRLLLSAGMFEKFLNRKYIGVTRFSLEGGEGVIPMLDEIVERSADAGCKEIILGMAHRGRLNVQRHILGKPLEELFSEFEHCYDPESLVGAGDVKYHNGYLNDVETAGGGKVRMLLVNNPSHLEAVNPVVEGIARARQDALGDGDRKRVMPLLIHGDAAFAGQGVVAETLNMSQLQGYTTGGTLHVVINNQIGYTTLPEDARSTRYSTDIAKMLMVPIFHVHGEDPEALIQVARLAVDYRNTFAKDIVVDVVCYRRYGHNEGDEPYFTQPQMYDRIRDRQPLYDSYGEILVEEGIATAQGIDDLKDGINRELEAAFEEIHGSVCLFPEVRFFDVWDDFTSRYPDRAPETGVPKDRLMSLSTRLNQVPEGFHLNPKLVKLMERRQKAVEAGQGIDWANAEALSFASLLSEGFPVRLSGQDCGRGTFSQRHSVWMDIDTGERRIPLNHVADGQAAYEVFNSLLAEFSVLGFEYGFSLVRPDTLILWEAQFGDFVNNAQTVIDLFLASGESKWQRLSGLALLLPHGYEGQGPEHSSARPERFLQLCANDNIQVCNPTTPAQYFHLLRRQMHRRVRKPLVVMTPKSLLRHPGAVSDLNDLIEGGFQEVIGDAGNGKQARRVIFCSGKIFYELVERRDQIQTSDAAIIRIEQFYPFPEKPLIDALSIYKRIKEWIWVQEEPENMGGWWFIRSRLEAITGKPLRFVGRPPSSSPASGFPKIYRRQQDDVVDRSVGPLTDGQDVS
ncbi:MAG: 2-oxoglutarate dehydrogenase E1 component [Desulfobacterales bacterium]